MSPVEDHDGPVSLGDALRDGWGDQDFYGWPEPAGGVDNRGGHPNEACRGSLPRPAGLRASSGESHPVIDCTGGEVPSPARRASLPVHPLPTAEARASGQEPAGVDRSEGKATPSQPRDAPEVGARPPRQGQPPRCIGFGEFDRRKDGPGCFNPANTPAQLWCERREALRREYISRQFAKLNAGFRR